MKIPDCSTPKKRVQILSPCYIVLLLMFCGTLLFCYYMDPELNYIKTICLVSGSQIIKSNCYYSCNCYILDRTNNCYVCDNVGYNSYINISYLIYYNTSLQVYSCINSFQIISQLTKTNYPNGTDIICYYNPDNPLDILLTLQDYSTYKLMAIITGIIFGVILLVWIFMELFKYIRNKIKQYNNILIV